MMARGLAGVELRAAFCVSGLDGRGGRVGQNTGGAAAARAGAGERLVNRTRGGRVLASDVYGVAGFGGRLLGLMGHPGLQPGQALVLDGDNSIHTLFMRFPIDVLFLDKAGRVRHLYHAMPPWRVSRVVFGSTRIVELPPGVLDATETEVGDELVFEPRP
jgi:uncharacterized membrane protein (UPF0127 family)